MIERARRTHGYGLKEAVNEALRRGLRELTAPAGPLPGFSTAVADLGACRLPTLDNTEDVLEMAEGAGR